MRIREVQTVCYVGAGTMGCYNSLVAAVSGYRVVLFDRDKDTLTQVAARQAEMAAMLVAGAYCSEQDIQTAMERVSTTDDMTQAVTAADLVSESVFEQVDIKRDVHRLLDQLCPSHTILTTNSSHLLVSDMEDVVARGDRFAAMHSHLGAPLVDLVPGPRTSGQTMDILRRFVESTGGVPLELNKEYPGYVLNAMLGPVLGTALLLVTTGTASVEQVDRTWMRDRSAPIGPFGLMDMFGLNLIHDSWQYRDQDDLFQTYRGRFLELLGPYIERGELGVKAGAGFYRYPAPAYQDANFIEGSAHCADISRALDVALVGSAALVAHHGVAPPHDIDRAWTVGMSLETGPFGLLRRLGVGDFCDALRAQLAQNFFDQDKAALALEYLMDNQAVLDGE